MFPVQRESLARRRNGDGSGFTYCKVVPMRVMDILENHVCRNWGPVLARVEAIWQFVLQSLGCFIGMACSEYGSNPNELQMAITVFRLVH